MVETRSTGCRGKKADDQPQEEMRVEPRDSPESPSVTENTTTAQMTHGEATVAEPSKSAVSTSSKRAPTVKSKTSRRRELARRRRSTITTVPEKSHRHDRQRLQQCCVTKPARKCAQWRTKNTEIGNSNSPEGDSKCLPRSQAQHQPSNSLHTVHEERKRSHKDIRDLPYFSGNHSDWLVFRTAYRQTAPYLEEIDNIVRLRKHIVGAAAEATKTLFINESSSQEIVDFLEQRYGAPDALVIAETNKLRALPKIGEEPHELYEFSAKVNGVVGTWYSYYAQNTHDVPDIIKLADFLNTECQIQENSRRPETSRRRRTSRTKAQDAHSTHRARGGRRVIV
ncbi:hypothetical protein EVAR_90409_1 [Eumeta japonica]|uniref:Uncharacterized protein n=1 Tax=Eumeta variegata TaxID=151549 RepID=A0A4C1YAC4_EUMVA|nr:hypothetical protein EVAR_90409_1 [Eumeta japonica]